MPSTASGSIRLRSLAVVRRDSFISSGTACLLRLDRVRARYDQAGDVELGHAEELAGFRARQA